jgi:hypothetical protein
MTTPTQKELVNALRGLQLEMAFEHERFRDVVLYCTHEEWALRFDDETPLWGATESNAQLSIEDDDYDLTLTAGSLLIAQELKREFAN